MKKLRKTNLLGLLVIKTDMELIKMETLLIKSKPSQLQLGEVDYDQKLGKLVYTESKEEYKYGEVNENEDSQEDDSD